ncbi:MAG: MgtC/SapB family protein [Bacilli bacterium]|nr:MgtC/SapB family protein [Bacilli bacterium]
MENKEFVIGIIVCFLLSCSVGLERQYRRRLIGLRTTILVAIGAYMFVSMSFIVVGGNVDITRIAAGVVSGISFLGAGAIIKDGLKVQGLTTAATLWCDAAIGVLCATGALFEAAVGTCIILFVNVILRPFNHYISKKSYTRNSRESFEIYVSVQNEHVKYISNLIKRSIVDHEKYEIDLESININKNKGISNIEVLLSIKTTHRDFIDELINELSSYEEVCKVEYKKIADFIALDEEF